MNPFYILSIFFVLTLPCEAQRHSKLKVLTEYEVKENGGKCDTMIYNQQRFDRKGRVLVSIYYDDSGKVHDGSYKLYRGKRLIRKIYFSSSDSTGPDTLYYRYDILGRKTMEYGKNGRKYKAYDYKFGSGSVEEMDFDENNEVWKRKKIKITRSWGRPVSQEWFDLAYYGRWDTVPKEKYTWKWSGKKCVEIVRQSFNTGRYEANYFERENYFYLPHSRKVQRIVTSGRDSVIERESFFQYRNKKAVSRENRYCDHGKLSVLEKITFDRDGWADTITSIDTEGKVRSVQFFRHEYY
ncbi:MAG TPA: hypothetical protein VI112_06865 [Bacteroidia bacterium]|jgi:hypothetical protein